VVEDGLGWLCVPNSLRERFDLEALEARPLYGRPAYVLDTSLGPSSGANLSNKALYSVITQVTQRQLD